MKATLTKWGDSQGVRLPKHLLDVAGIGEQDALEVVADETRIIITKAGKTPHKTIQERFRGFTGAYESELVDWGPPEGREIW